MKRSVIFRVVPRVAVNQILNSPRLENSCISAANRGLDAIWVKREGLYTDRI